MFDFNYYNAKFRYYRSASNNLVVMTLFIVLYVWGSNPRLPPPLSKYLENCILRKKNFTFVKLLVMLAHKRILSISTSA